MKKIILFLCVITMLFSSVSVAFACDTCQADVENQAAKIYISDYVRYFNNNTGSANLIYIRNQGAFGTSNRGAGIFKLNLNTVNKSWEYIKNVTLNFYVTKSNNPLYLTAFEAEYDWSKHDDNPYI